MCPTRGDRSPLILTVHASHPLEVIHQPCEIPTDAHPLQGSFPHPLWVIDHPSETPTHPGDPLPPPWGDTTYLPLGDPTTS